MTENQNRRLHRNDCILTVTVCVTALLIWVLYAFMPGRTADTQSLSVSIDGKTVATVPLTEDARYEYLDGAFVLAIEGGRAYVAQSNCPDGECAHMHIDAHGGQIVCLPNRIVITAKTDSSDVDFRLG